ncbi:MAG: asparagine synthetase B [Methanosphaera sp.]|nr:asparagine synthetase B [Methanosphaera sp.]
MCSIIAINNNATLSKIECMLNVLNKRGPDGQGVYSKKDVYYNNDINNAPNSNFMMAHNLLSIVGSNELQPISSNNLVLVSNAEIYNYKQLIDRFNLTDLRTESDCEVILKLIEYFYDDNLLDAVISAQKYFIGDYSFIITDGIDYVALRDPVGVKPLHYAVSNDSFAIASQEVALKEAGFNEVFDLNPRCLICNDEVIRYMNDYKHYDEFIDYNLAKQKLKNALINSVLRRCDDLDEVAILFSGGIDSTIIAKILKSHGKNVTLYTIGIENSQDLKVARKIADDMDLPLKTWIIDQDIIEKSLLDTINTIEDTNLMKIGVGMTIKLTSQLAHIDHHKVILSGQGADELFAGYNRYKKKIDHPEELIEELDNDLNNIYHVNLERDDKATMSNSLELRVPYLDQDVIDVALRINPQDLISDSDDNLRKRLLRDVALELGIKEEYAQRPKKAAQYATGIDKILRKKIIKQEKYANMLNYPSR